MFKTKSDSWTGSETSAANKQAVFHALHKVPMLSQYEMQIKNRVPKVGGGRSPGALKFFPWSPEPHRFVAWSPHIILL